MMANLNTLRKRNNTLSILGVAALLSVAVLPLGTGLVTPGVPTAAVDTVAPSAAAAMDFSKLPLSFEANHGQTDPSVRYMAHASGGTMYFTRSEVVLALHSAQPTSGRQASGAKGFAGLTSVASIAFSDKEADAKQMTSVVRLQFIGANPNTVMSSGEAMPGKVNYFIGNDPSRWHSDVPTYASAHYEQLYAGIGLTYDGTGGQLKGTYTVSPGSDPSQIRWRYSGAESVSVDGAGNLQIAVPAADKDASPVMLTEQVPVAWQEIGGTRTAVTARYLVASDQSTGFALGSYDHNLPITIDPTLAYSTYLGGSNFDYGSGIAVDTAGNAYVTGATFSSNFPLQGPYQPSYRGPRDAFVTKFNPGGTTLLYSTYLGGTGQGDGDGSYGIAVDTVGNAYVTGYTTSNDFPLQNPFQPAYGGGNSDVFVTKLNATGSALIYSTYLGGNVAQEWGMGIAVDTSGNAYVAGFTGSTNFPLQNPFQPAFGGVTDAFVTKFSPAGSSLIYSTYLGGSGNDAGWGGIAVDISGNAYVTGYTESTDFPLQNPFQPLFRGVGDAFVTKFSPGGTTLLYSTYLGGSDLGITDVPYDIAVDISGSAYVTGYTGSTDFPLQNPFQPTYGGGDYDAFVTKFSPGGSTLLYSTYLGGSGSFDRGEAITVDEAGSAYLTGETNSTNFPLQIPFQQSLGGQSDAFVTKFSPTGSTLLYSTYLGGIYFDYGDAIAVDTSGSAYLTGYTNSTNFPLQNPFQPAIGGGGWSDAFVTKVSDGVVSTPTATPVQPTNTSTPMPTPSMPTTTTPVPPSGTPVPPTSTSVPPTGTVASTATATAIPPTPCTLEFIDVPPGSTFYPFVRCLACRGIVNGYADNTFRPNNNVTRGQLSKIVSNAASYSEPAGAQLFEDVAPGSTFYDFVERLASRGYINGYPCGSVGEPCGGGNLPYFRPNNNATRGQISKIVSNAAGFSDPVGAQLFEDVALGSTFSDFIYRLASRSIINGYPCGGPGEPCGGGNLPYFRPNANATRGQTSKIVANTFFPNCQTRAQR
ncbi:MAG: SBBP repeat-containing protein [Chloroflexota bacterium]